MGWIQSYELEIPSLGEWVHPFLSQLFWWGSIPKFWSTNLVRKDPGSPVCWTLGKRLEIWQSCQFALAQLQSSRVFRKAGFSSHSYDKLFICVNIRASRLLSHQSWPFFRLQSFQSSSFWSNLILSGEKQSWSWTVFTPGAMDGHLRRQTLSCASQVRGLGMSGGEIPSWARWSWLEDTQGKMIMWHGSNFDTPPQFGQDLKSWHPAIFCQCLMYLPVPVWTRLNPATPSRETQWKTMSHCDGLLWWFHLRQPPLVTLFGVAHIRENWAPQESTGLHITTPLKWEV